MNNEGFRFKHFEVRHDRCAMKVGTDGVLLGAWAEAPATASRALDVGTGTGLIALMLAQRFPALTIEGLDIDEGAVEQASENFHASPWADRLSARTGDFILSSTTLSDNYYDLIVCNPPFFSGGKGMDARREQARQSSALPLPSLIERAAQLLRKGGTLALVLPQEQASAAILQAAMHQLLLTRRTDVRTTPAKPPARCLLQWRKPASRGPEFAHATPLFAPPDTAIPLLRTQLTLNDAHGKRSEAYEALTRDFYL